MDRRSDQLGYSRVFRRKQRVFLRGITKRLYVLYLACGLGFSLRWLWGIMKADMDDGDPKELEYGVDGDGWVAGYCWLCFVRKGNG